MLYRKEHTTDTLWLIAWGFLAEVTIDLPSLPVFSASFIAGKRNAMFISHTIPAHYKYKS